MNINKELIFKESLPFFKNLSKEEKNILYDASHIEEYKAGELIYSKYKSCTGLVLVANGQLRSMFFSSFDRFLKNGKLSLKINSLFIFI